MSYHIGAMRFVESLQRRLQISQHEIFYDTQKFPQQIVWRHSWDGTGSQAFCIAVSLFPGDGQCAEYMKIIRYNNHAVIGFVKKGAAEYKVLVGIGRFVLQYNAAFINSGIYQVFPHSRSL